MRRPETWDQVRLGDVLTRVETKLDPQTSDVESHFYIGLEHIESHTGKLLREAEDVTESRDILSTKTVFQKGDILYGKLRPNLNKVYLADQEGICSTDIWALRATDQILPEFACLYLRSPAICMRAAQLATGANLPRLPASAFDQLPIPLPTLPEQHRLVDVLNLAENLRRQKEYTLKLSTDLTKALFEQYFGIAGASTAWPMESFGKHTTYSKYGPRFPDQPYSDSGIHILRTTDMNEDGTIRWWEAPKLSLTKKQIQEHVLKPGTLVISRSGTIGPFALIDGQEGQCVAGAYLIEFGLADSVEPEYIRALFATPYMQQMLKRAVRSMAIPNINAPNIQAIPIPIPDRKRQEAFAVQIKKLRAWASEISKSAIKVDELIHAVVGEAFSGELTAHWRELNASQIILATTVRDMLLHERGAKLRSPGAEPKFLPSQPVDSEYPVRHWLIGELSEFQRQVLAAFKDYYEKNDQQPILAEDPDEFTRFCDGDEVTERLQIFGPALNYHIRRTLSQLAALGLIAKVTLPKQNLETGEREFLKAFRPVREAEFTRFDDVTALRKMLSASETSYHFTMVLDFETSTRAGAGGMFQVADLRDDDDQDRTDLVDQGKHYSEIKELAADIAQRLGVRTDQVVLEEV